MKKILSVIYSFVISLCVLTTSIGCSEKPYEIPHDRFCYSADGQQTIDLALEDKEYIINLLNESEWTDDISNCGADFVFYTQKQEVRYHSECGTFNDITSEKGLQVTENQRLHINSLLEGTFKTDEPSNE